MDTIIREDFTEKGDDIIHPEGNNILHSAVEANNEDTLTVILNWIMDAKDERGKKTRQLVESSNSKVFNLYYRRNAGWRIWR